MCAICVGLENNIEISKILEGTEKFELTKNRMEIIKTKTGVSVINDSYNASYDSVKAALEYLKITKGKRKIAVLGDLFELGDFAKEIHTKIGEEVYKNLPDMLITVGENIKFAAKKATELGMDSSKVFMYDTKEEAILKIKNETKDGDFLLVKASSPMKFKEIVKEIT